MPKNIFGQKMPNQPRAVNRKMLDTPVAPNIAPLGEDDDPTKRQTETLVSALRNRKPKKASFMGV